MYGLKPVPFELKPVPFKLTHKLSRYPERRRSAPMRYSVHESGASC
jgi:hypothetical protein